MRHLQGRHLWAAMLLLLAGCETMETVGQTMETFGQAMMGRTPPAAPPPPQATAPTEAAAPSTQEAAAAPTQEAPPAQPSEAAPSAPTASQVAPAPSPEAVQPQPQATAPPPAAVPPPAAPPPPAAAVPPPAATPPVPPAATPTPYDALLEQAKRGDPVDFAALRYAYTETPSYAPYDSPLTPIRRTMFAALKAQDCDKAAADAERILAAEYVSIDANYVAEQCARQRGDDKRAAEAHRMVDGLVRSILNSGNGHTPESAFIVIAVSEERSLLALLGYSVTKETIGRFGRSDFDRLELKRPEGDGTDIVFFNIDRPLGWLAKHVSAPERSPSGS